VLILKVYSEAIIDCDKALEINPNIGAAFNHRGLAKIKLGLKEYNTPQISDHWLS
jgi:hypothetical protein